MCIRLPIGHSQLSVLPSFSVTSPTSAQMAPLFSQLLGVSLDSSFSLISNPSVNPLCLFKLHPESPASQDFPRCCPCQPWLLLDLLQSPISALSLSPLLFSAWALLLNTSQITSVFCSKLSSPGFPDRGNSHHSGPLSWHILASPLAALSHLRLLSCVSCNPESCPHWSLCLSCFLSLECAPRPL